MFLRDVRRGTAARCIRSIASSGRLPPTDRKSSICGRRGASAIAHHALICTVPWTQGLTTACCQLRVLRNYRLGAPLFGADQHFGSAINLNIRLRTGRLTSISSATDEHTLGLPQHVPHAGFLLRGTRFGIK